MADTFGHLDADDVELAKTADRSVLGCMNDMAFQCELATLDARDIRRLDVARLNHRLRRTIFRPLGDSYPIELAADVQPATDREPPQPPLRLVHGRDEH